MNLVLSSIMIILIILNFLLFKKSKSLCKLGAIITLIVLIAVFSSQITRLERYTDFSNEFMDRLSNTGVKHRIFNVYISQIDFHCLLYYQMEHAKNL